MLGGMESSGRAGGKKDEYVTMASVDNPLVSRFAHTCTRTDWMVW